MRLPTGRQGRQGRQGAGCSICNNFRVLSSINFNFKSVRLNFSSEMKKNFVVELLTAASRDPESPEKSG
jgi:hypothetical protein